MGNSVYRERIYRNYVQGRQAALAPETTAGLMPRAPYLRRMIKRHFPEDRQAAILDLGCGHGAILHFAREMGYENIRGIDTSPEQVAAARALGIPGVEQGDIVPALVGLSASSQECIINFDVIEHFNREELIPLVDDVFRVLRPGGRWIIHTANGESPFSGISRYADFTHELAFTRISIAQLLFSSGFGSVRCFEDEPVPHGLKSAVRWMMWKMIRALLRLYLAAETGDLGQDAVLTQTFLTVAVK